VDEQKSPYVKKATDPKAVLFYSLAISVFIIAISFAYYNFIFKPKLEREKAEAVEIAKKEKEALDTETVKRKSELLGLIMKDYERCKNNKYDVYKEAWDAKVKHLVDAGLQAPGTDTLPPAACEPIELARKEGLEQCEREYKQALEVIKIQFK